MDLCKLLSQFCIFTVMTCVLFPVAFPKKQLGRSENVAIESGYVQKVSYASYSSPFEVLKNTKRKRALEEAGPNTEMECPKKRWSRSYGEWRRCPQTFCQHVSYRCNMQCQGQDRRDANCELYNCTGSHHCSSYFEITIPIEEVCDDIDQCPDSDDESTCVRPCWPSCMCIGLMVDYRGTNLDISDFLFNNMFIMTNQNDPQSVGVSHLSYLSYLVITGIHNLPKKFITGFHNLKSLDLSNNKITFLSDYYFRDVSSLVSLKLSSNMITDLSNNVFNGLSALNFLDLSQNQISVLPNYVFNGLSSLEGLELSRNQISVLPNNVFNGLSALNSLDLSRNQISALPNNVFNGLFSLEVLDLSQNQISVLPNNVFNGLSALDFLDLSQNQISVLPNNVFNGLFSLIGLNLRRNQISDLPNNVFNGLFALQDLYLSQNQISVIPNNVFNGLFALDFLDLSQNQISVLPNYVFNGLSSLEGLDLSQNQTSVLPNNVFNGLFALRFLQLSQNQISVIPNNVFNGLFALQDLYLSQNQISVLSNNVFNGLFALNLLNLSQNQISVLPNYVFNGLSTLQSLYLSQNQISVLPNNVFNGLFGLNLLNLSQNQISVLPNNVFNGLSALQYLYLSHNQIAVLPGDLLSRHPVVGILLLSGNRLSVLPSLPLSVEVLDISYNSFTNLHYGSFINNSKMSLLSVVGNDLEVKKHMFEGLDNLETLMTDTPFLCCVKPKSVSKDRCIKTSISDIQMIDYCSTREQLCKSEVDAISSCDALIGSAIQRVCLWIIGVCALIGNIMVFFYRLFIDRDNITKSYSLFVVNLCVSDFFMGVYLLIIGVADVYYSGVYAWNDRKWRRSIVCTTAGILSTISSEMSTFLILLITVDRVIVIAFPMSRISRWNISWKQVIIISVSLWFVSITLAIIPIVAVQSYFKGEYYSQSGVCLALPLTGNKRPGSEYSFAIFVCLNSIIFIVIVIGQICIIKSIITSGGRITSSQTRQRDMSVARTLVMVVATDFCCWFPIGVMGVMSKSGYNIPDDAYAWVMIFVLPVNAAINPFLYTATAIWRKRQREKRRIEMISPKRNQRHQADGIEMETPIQ